jgi:CRISPR/Cas system-associated exonuclease Cas4 (RecB family)
MSTNFITNEALYDQVIKPVANATSFVWIGTADIKDLHVHYKGAVKSFLTVLDTLVRNRVAIRLLHAKEPGVNFRKSFDQYPLLWKNMERQLCPRVHFKHIIIDGVVEAIMNQFDEVWMGKYCKDCGRKDFCSDPILYQNCQISGNGKPGKSETKTN